jgi:hypothetical protein
MIFHFVSSVNKSTEVTVKSFTKSTQTLGRILAIICDASLVASSCFIHLNFSIKFVISREFSDSIILNKAFFASSSDKFDISDNFIF